MYHYSVKKKRRVSRRLIILIIFLFVLAGIFYALFLSPLFKIKAIIISGNKKISTEEIKSSFVCDNIFLTTRESIRGQLFEKNPIISDLTIKKDIFKGKLEINIQEREVIGIFCKQSLSKCFYFDKNGIIFENAPNTSGSLINLVNDYSQKDFKLGDEVLTVNFINTISIIKDYLSQKLGLRAKSFDVESYPVEELRVVTNESWYILFSLTRDINGQLLALKVALDEKIQNRMNLQYVDLRIENRIYYK